MSSSFVSCMLSTDQKMQLFGDEKNKGLGTRILKSFMYFSPSCPFSPSVACSSTSTTSVSALLQGCEVGMTGPGYLME